MIELADLASLAVTVGAAVGSVKGLNTLRQNKSEGSAAETSAPLTLDQLRQSAHYKSLDAAMRGQTNGGTLSDLEAQLEAERIAKEQAQAGSSTSSAKIVIRVRQPEPSVKESAPAVTNTPPPKIYITPSGVGKSEAEPASLPDRTGRPVIKVLRNGRYVPINDAYLTQQEPAKPALSLGEQKTQMIQAIAQFQRGLSTATVDEALAGIALLNRTVDFYAAPDTVDVKDIVLVKKVFNASTATTYYVVGLGLNSEHADVWLTTFVCDSKNRWGIYIDTQSSDTSALARLPYARALITELATY